MDLAGFLHGSLAIGLFMALLILVAMPLLARCSFTRGLARAGSVEAQCHAAIATVICLALAGLVIALLPVAAKRASALALLVLLLLTTWYVCRRLPVPVYKGDWFFLRAVVVLALTVLALGHVRWPLPNTLADGAYVNKEDVTAVRIQRFTGNLPPDNVVSYVAMEYLARNISFKDNAPILPGQQVTNRPVLASLVALPIRVLLRPVREVGVLPSFEYVGSHWPDFRQLVRDQRVFSVYLGVLVLLNALMLLGVGCLLTRALGSAGAPRWALVLLYGSSPYFLFQTLFTWPKALAGFFLILAATAYWWHRRRGWAGSLLGLAYLAHPYAIGYAIVAVAASLLWARGSAFERGRAAATISLCFVLVILPWLIWANVILGLESDLVTQNLLTGDTTPFAFAWMRVANTATALLPMHLTNPSATFMDMFRQSAFNVSGAVGLLVLVGFLASCMARPVPPIADASQTVTAPMLGLFLASACLLGFVFSAPAVPALHGGQPMAALLMCICVHRAFHEGPVWAKALIYAQIILNLALWACYFDSMFVLPVS